MVDGREKCLGVGGVFVVDGREECLARGVSGRGVLWWTVGRDIWREECMC